jgi:hypothetical protein
MLRRRSWLDFSRAPDANKEASDVIGIPAVPSVPELVDARILELEEAFEPSGEAA